MAIRNRLNTKKNPKLSRSDKWKKNPVPWVVLLFLTLSVGWYFVFDDFQDLIKKKSEISDFTIENAKLTEENELLNINLNEIKVEFDKKASEAKTKEKQIFPEKIDTKRIVKVLEIFSLILHYNISDFSLDSINFSKPTKSKNDNYSKLQSNLRLIGSKENINNFVDFLKIGELPPKIKQKLELLNSENDSSDLSQIAMELRFLKQNHLPLATLESIKINKVKSNNQNNVDDSLSAELQVIFYSRN